MPSEKELNWFKKRCWAEINIDHIAHNVKEIKKHIAKRSMLLAVVKADAYGHGEGVIVPELDKMQEVEWFGVSELEEALSIREHGVDKPTLVFTPPMAQYADLIAANNLTITIPSYEYAQRVNDFATAQGVTVFAHLKLDTGMGRLGIKVEEDKLDENLEEILKIYRLPNIKLTGIYTHFATADCIKPDLFAHREYQFRNFDKALKKLELLGLDIGIRHCANSAAILCDKEYHMDMVRAGIIIYGNSPGPRCDDVLDLKSTMEIFTRITQVKELSVGDKIGYGCTFEVKKPITVATIGLGYADGYPRLMSNKAKMLVRGKKTVNIGRVCMDQMMLDVSDIDINADEIVTVVGKDGNEEITWDWLAESIGTISYEVMCLVSKRVFRVYIKNGVAVSGFSYMNK